MTGPRERDDTSPRVGPGKRCVGIATGRRRSGRQWLRLCPSPGSPDVEGRPSVPPEGTCRLGTLTCSRPVSTLFSYRGIRATGTFVGPPSSSVLGTLNLQFTHPSLCPPDSVHQAITSVTRALWDLVGPPEDVHGRGLRPRHLPQPRRLPGPPECLLRDGVGEGDG